MTFTWSFPTDQSHNISNTWLLNEKLESRPRFCLIDVEYSIFYSDTKWNYHGDIPMQKRLLNIQVLPKQQSILKIKKVWLLAWNKCTKWLSFQTTCLWVVFVSGLPCGTERDWSVHLHVLHSCCFADQDTLRFFNLCFFFIHYETTTKAKFIYLRNLREWQLNLKSMKMTWIIKMVKLMIVVHSLTQTIFEIDPI